MVHNAKVKAASFGANDTRIVTIAWDEAHIWDTRTLDKLNSMVLKDGFKLAAFSTDGTHLVTASEGGTAHVWDVKTGKTLGEPMVHKKSISSAKFSVDGTRVVTASSDNTARIWDVLPVISDPNNLLADLAEAVTGLRLGEYGAIETLADQIERLNL